MTTPTVSAPISFLAISAMTGAAPVPVPPPSPAVTKTMSAPLSASLMSSRDSAAAPCPMSGLAPAPSPFVSSWPMLELDVGVAHRERLGVGVRRDELDAAQACVDHAVDRIGSAAADADDLDDCEVAAALHGSVPSDPSVIVEGLTPARARSLPHVRGFARICQPGAHPRKKRCILPNSRPSPESRPTLDLRSRVAPGWRRGSRTGSGRASARGRRGDGRGRRRRRPAGCRDACGVRATVGAAAACACGVVPDAPAAFGVARRGRRPRRAARAPSRRRSGRPCASGRRARGRPTSTWPRGARRCRSRGRARPAARARGPWTSTSGRPPRGRAARPGRRRGRRRRSGRGRRRRAGRPGRCRPTTVGSPAVPTRGRSLPSAVTATRRSGATSAAAGRSSRTWIFSPWGKSASVSMPRTSG